MEKHRNSFLPAIFMLCFVFGSSYSACLGATQEIDMGDDVVPTTNPTPVPKTVSAPAAQQMAVATPTPVSQNIDMEGNTGPATETTPEATPGVYEIHGVLKMKDVYEAGVKAYQEQDYDRAIRYWTQALKMQDPYTPKFIYAETNAMLGVIYQYHIINYYKAYWYYKAAQKYEPGNRTAKRHIRQVYKYRHQKD